MAAGGRFLAVCVTALCLAGCADMRTAKTAYERGDYKTAIENWEPLSDYGIPEAQINLALMYLKGEGVGPDAAKAVALLEQAAKAGEPRALFEIGKILEAGEGGLAQDKERAKSFYQEALDMGYVRAAAGLAGIAEDEDDYGGAETLYRQALAGGYFKAAMKIGRLYENGKGRQPDPVMALAWYYKARDNGVGELDGIIATLETQIGHLQTVRARQLAQGIS